MSVLNQKVEKLFTYEGAVAKHITPIQQLRRSVLSTMLFEDTFYESGETIAHRIKSLIPQCDPLEVSKLASEAREKMGLRHAPLLILREMARLDAYKRYVGRTLARIITRPDQMCDFLALYWQDNDKKKMSGSMKRKTLSAKVKQGLAHAFNKFNEYELAKYNRLDKQVKLRDVLFLCHAKPKDEEQAAVWKKLINNELTTPDTWEVALSAGNDKKETWERLMRENKLGALAFVRNLRNMKDVGVNESQIELYSQSIDVKRVYPWQFIASASVNPYYETMIENMMLRNQIKNELPDQKLKGKTLLLIDNSGSMYGAMASKSKMQRIDAACGIAILIRNICESVSIFAFSEGLTELPTRYGFALRDAIKATPSGGTCLGAAVTIAEQKYPDYQRIIVITDEQSHDRVKDPFYRGYMMNVGSNKNGVGYGKWVHIDGFSSSIIEWIKQYEQLT